MSLPYVFPGEPFPFVHRLERLVHLELADLADNAPYLLPSFPNIVWTGFKLGPTTRRRRCQDCKYHKLPIIHYSLLSGGSIHKEIFALKRLSGANRGREWEVIVRPIIERYGSYIQQYYVR